jgi:hypothetical protein
VTIINCASCDLCHRHSLALSLNDAGQVGGDGVSGPREHNDLEQRRGGRALPWHRADIGFVVHTHYPGALGLREWIRVVLSWPLIFFLRGK